MLIACTNSDSNMVNGGYMYSYSMCFFYCATVCKTVRPMLYRPLSVLSVTLVYCGQTVGWIKMALGMEVGLSPGDFLLDGV